MLQRQEENREKGESRVGVRGGDKQSWVGGASQR